MGQEKLYEKVKAIIFGHAVGDAVGGPVQFQEREMRDRYPVTDMMPFEGARFPKGTWSDDTSMSLCAIDALTKYGLDFREVMENFKKWLCNDEFTSAGLTFDVGRACYLSIVTAKSWSERAEGYGRCGENENGNGSLMRIYPFSLYLYYSDFPIDGKVAYIHRASALTHAHPRSCMGCGIYSFIIWELLEDPTKHGIKEGLNKAKEYYQGETELKHYYRLFEEGFDLLPRNEIKSSGYVVDTLEAAVWCALTTENFRDCILKAVNLGLDTDSVGAVAGSFAGLLYGYESIPENWLHALLKKEYLEDIGRKFGYVLCSQVPQGEYKLHKSFALEPVTKSDLTAAVAEDKDKSWENDFYWLAEDLFKNSNKNSKLMLFCNGISPKSWHTIEECPIFDSDEKIVVFEYGRYEGISSRFGLAFTTYRNCQKFLRSVSKIDARRKSACVPLWDYTAIYRIPDFGLRSLVCCDATVAHYTFREVQGYLVEKFGLKMNNITAWGGGEDREYTIGSFVRIVGPARFKKVLRK